MSGRSASTWARTASGSSSRATRVAVDRSVVSSGEALEAVNRSRTSQAAAGTSHRLPSSPVDRQSLGDFPGAEPGGEEPKHLELAA